MFNHLSSGQASFILIVILLFYIGIIKTDGFGLNKKNNASQISETESPRTKFSETDYEVGCLQSGGQFCLSSEGEETYRRCIREITENCKTWSLQYKTEIEGKNAK